MTKQSKVPKRLWIESSSQDDGFEVESKELLSNITEEQWASMDFPPICLGWTESSSLLIETYDGFSVHMFEVELEEASGNLFWPAPWPLFGYLDCGCEKKETEKIKAGRVLEW